MFILLHLSWGMNTLMSLLSPVVVAAVNAHATNRVVPPLLCRFIRVWLWLTKLGALSTRPAFPPSTINRLRRGSRASSSVPHSNSASHHQLSQLHSFSVQRSSRHVFAFGVYFW